MTSSEIHEASVVRRFNALSYRQLDGMTFREIGAMQRTTAEQSRLAVKAAERIVKSISPKAVLLIRAFSKLQIT